MADSLLKALSSNQEVVVYTLDATDLVQESLQRIGLWPPSAKHLGQAMMGSLLLQALNEDETVSLQWMCDGPFGHCFAEAKNFGSCRGTISLPRPENVADYETSLGEGLLQIRKTRSGTSTTSVVQAQGNVSLDLVEYLEKSEQKSCGLGLSVAIDWADAKKKSFRVSRAVAYLIHILPQPSEIKMNEALRRWDAQMQALGPLSGWSLRTNSTTADIARLLLSEEPNVVMNQRIEFSCNCSAERAERALALLESEDKEPPVEAGTEIRCEFCGKVYTVPVRGRA